MSDADEGTLPEALPVLLTGAVEILAYHRDLRYRVPVLHEGPGVGEQGG